MSIKTLFWFRNDLRISDNPGLLEASKNGSVMPIYIMDDRDAGDFKMGSASKWWLHHSLNSLNTSLDNSLSTYCGSAFDIIIDLIEKHKITHVYWNRCYEPLRIQSDSVLKKHLIEMGIECKSFNACLLWEPWQVLKKDQSPYKVFTPYYRNGCLSAPAPRTPLPKPENLQLIKDDASQTIDELNLLPHIHWYDGMEKMWNIGEQAAYEKCDVFLENGIKGYKDLRNFPEKRNVSRLSPHLHFGEISPHQVWHAARIKGTMNGAEDDLDCFLSEIGWREFSYYLLYHFPDLPRNNFQPKFDNFPWQENFALLKAWQSGQTGYPIIDAGMRELWQTGYMHNRVRMIVGSFLVKNLRIHWHHGEDWFWDCLVDADLASNSASWQWVAGSGADASPYFRIFNPVLQGQKFDVDGEYTRRFVPELSKLPSKYLFNPWAAPETVLRAAGVDLGKTYPKPIVNLEKSRDEALEAYRIAFKL